MKACVSSSQTDAPAYCLNRPMTTASLRFLPADMHIETRNQGKGLQLRWNGPAAPDYIDRFQHANSTGLIDGLASARRSFGGTLRGGSSCGTGTRCGHVHRRHGACSMLSLCPMLRTLILNRDGSQGLPMLLLQTKLHLQHPLCTSTNGRSCCSFLLLVSDDRIVWDYGMPLVR